MNFNSFKNEPFTLEDIFNDSTYQFSNKELIKSELIIFLNQMVSSGKLKKIILSNGEFLFYFPSSTNMNGQKQETQSSQSSFTPLRSTIGINGNQKKGFVSPFLKRSAPVEDASDSGQQQKSISSTSTSINSPQKKQKLNNNQTTSNSITEEEEQEKKKMQALKMPPAFQFDIQQMLKMNDQQLNAFEERLKSKKGEREKSKKEVMEKLADPKKSIMKGDEDGKTACLISKWKLVCKEAAVELLRLSKQTNPEITMAQILAFYQIEHEMLDFKDETDSFE